MNPFASTAITNRLEDHERQMKWMNTEFFTKKNPFTTFNHVYVKVYNQESFTNLYA